MGTARILTLSLSNSRCFVGEDFSEHEALNALLSEPNVEHWVLFPGEGAQSYEQVRTRLQQAEPKVRLRVILLDGTWKKAYKMWQLSTNLHALPKVALPTDLVGNYRIRKSPSANSLSTVEAGYHILRLLEPRQDFTPLINTFEKMIDFQIAQMPPGVFEKNYQG